MKSLRGIRRRPYLDQRIWRSTKGVSTYDFGNSAAGHGHSHVDASELGHECLPHSLAAFFKKLDLMQQRPSVGAYEAGHGIESTLDVGVNSHRLQ